MHRCQRGLCSWLSSFLSFPTSPVGSLSWLNIYVRVSSPWCWCLGRNLTYTSLHCPHYWKHIRVLSATVTDAFVNLRTQIIFMVTPGGKKKVSNVIASPSETCHLSHSAAYLHHNLVPLISGTFLFYSLDIVYSFHGRFHNLKGYSHTVLFWQRKKTEVLESTKG